MRIHFYFFACILALLLSACEKEKDLQFEEPAHIEPGGGNGNNPEIAGEYTVVGVTGITLAEVTMTVSGTTNKTITRSYYTGKEVEGSAVITSNRINFYNTAFTVDTLQYFQTYLNGSLLMEDELPLEIPASPVSSSASYAWVAGDSLRMYNMTGGPVADNPVPGQTMIAEQGARATWSGDTLVLNTNAVVNTTVTPQGSGIPAIMKGYIRGILKLKRK
ncbi:MAG TPA: hypothetical protein PKC69_09410 [Chitinophagaceae bacterium]|nr:hypothetical protein [Chitinophagaceae bacterium]